MADEAAIGRLSEVQNEHIFRTEILPDYLPEMSEVRIGQP